MPGCRIGSEQCWCRCSFDGIGEKSLSRDYARIREEGEERKAEGSESIRHRSEDAVSGEQEPNEGGRGQTSD